MNFYAEILKLKQRLESLVPPIDVELNKNEDIERRLHNAQGLPRPVIVIEAGRTDGNYLSSGKFDVLFHNALVHCIVTSHKRDYATACVEAEDVATMVMKQMHGLKMRVRENGVDRDDLLIGSLKARDVFLEVEANE